MVWRTRRGAAALVLVIVLGTAACSDDDSGARDGAVTDGQVAVDGGLDAAVVDAAPGDAAPGDSGTASDAAPDGGTPTACGDIQTFADGVSPTSELHVAVGGSDTTGNGTAGNPYATIEHAANLATPGTAVRVHAGTYSGGHYIADLAGTATAPIWIGGAPGEARPVIQGGGEAIHLVRARYLVVHGLEVSGPTDNGINCDDGGDYANDLATHDVIFRNLYIHDVGTGGNQDCLKLSGLNHYFVLDNEFHDCGGGGSGSAVDHVGCHHGLLARNEMYSLAGGNAVQNKGGSEDIEIRWNVMTDAGERAVNMGGSTGFTYFRPPLDTSAENAEAIDIRVIGNVIEGGVASLAFVGCVDCLAANNTIVDPTNWVLRILQETTTSGGYTFAECRNGTFINNLVYFDRSDLSTTINIGPNTQANTFIFTTNLWYAHDAPSQSTPTDLPVTETGGVYGQDPAFTTGYAIGAGSPAAGAGTAVTGVTGDITGACYASPPSIGAYEVP